MARRSSRSAADPRTVLIALARAPAGEPAGDDGDGRDRPAGGRLPPGVCYAAACRLARHPDLLLGGASAAAVAGRLGLPAAAVERVRALCRDAAAVARREERRAAELGVEIVTAADPGYPEAFTRLDLPPPALVVAGRLPAADTAPPAVAIVGSRRASAYAREAAEWFGRELAAAGLAVVSGLARGVDAAAHRGALAGRAGPGAAAPGPAIAVLGAGIDLDYPRGHRRLRREIAAAGAVLTEFPCGAPPRPWRFPVRNRLIAALADAVLVVEAAERSGSLITARFALDLGREVFAVPGRVFDAGARGVNRLIADGAQVALEPRDLLERLGVAPRPQPAEEAPATEGPAAGAPTSQAPAAEAPATQEPAAGAPAPAARGTIEARVLAALAPGEPRHAEQVARSAGAAVERVLAALAELELAGRVRRWPGPAFTARP